MRFLHLADLHIGKRVNEFSMLADQRFILDQIVQKALAAHVDAVLIAGDVYDKPVPSTEALEVFEHLLGSFSQHEVPVLVIPGNHDSAERLSFGSRFMDAQGIHIARAFSEKPQVVHLSDQYGPVDIHLLPFVKPVYVRAAFPDEEISSYQDAVAVAVAHMPIDPDVRSVLVAHQFVTNAGTPPEVVHEPGLSVAVGGVDNVDASLFAAFHYVALGHVHISQQIGRPEVRYCGTPLKYSFSESGRQLVLNLVDLDAQGAVQVEEVPLQPLHDMREVRGSLEELRAQAGEEGPAAEDYLHVTLTDEALMDAMAKVREFYPHTMTLDFAQTEDEERAPRIEADPSHKTIPQLFDDYFLQQTGEQLSDQQEAVVAAAAREAGEDR